MTRTDAHRPSAIQPAEYDFVALDYYGPDGFECMEMVAEKQAFRDHMAATGAKFAHNANRGTCYVCGAGALYVAKYHHAPSNSYIVTGMDCAAKLDMDDAVLFASFRKRIAAGRDVWAGKNKARGLLADWGLSAAWGVYEAGASDRDGGIVAEMVGKLVQYGSLSEKQQAFLAALMHRIANRDQIIADRKAADAGSAHVGTVGERRDWTLTLQGRFEYETDYGVTYGHVYKDADGNVVIYKGSNRLDGERGDTVTLKATVKAHADREGVQQTMISRPKVAA